jgi:type II secretion system protein G
MVVSAGLLVAAAIALWPKLLITDGHPHRDEMSTLCSAVEQFRMDTGRYPTEAEGLQALVEKPAGAENWDGPYLEPPKIPLDQWGMPYMYHTRVHDEETEYLIVSYGPSRKPGPGNVGSKGIDPAAWLSGQPVDR